MLFSGRTSRFFSQLSDWTSGNLVKFRALGGRGSLQIILYTDHFMRNMSSPLLSVAPIILSGCNPLSNPRGLLSSSLKYNLNSENANPTCEFSFFHSFSCFKWQKIFAFISNKNQQNLVI